MASLRASIAVSRQILTRFPPISAAFAYGSGAFKQNNNHCTDNMLDIIMVVDNLKIFHSKNMETNPNHYSGVRALGATFVSTLNDLPAYVYYNTSVRIDGQLLKYGVISKDRFITDLLDWDMLYVAGRMQKPVQYLTDIDTEIKLAREMNLRSAMHVALLTLPETFELKDLFLRITSLSYDGDFRMIFGEDRNKVANIVKAQMDDFEEIYHPFLTNMSIIDWKPGASRVGQDLSESGRLHHLELLPKVVQHQLMIKWRPGENRHKDVEDVLKSIARNPASLCADVVQRSVRAIVRRSALLQSAKGLLTSGPVTAAQYCAAKIKKMMFSMRHSSNS